MFNIMKSIYFLCFAVLTNCFFSISISAAHPIKHQDGANWVRASWGTLLILPAGNRYEVEHFNVNALISQLSGLKSFTWVMLNLTNENDDAHFTGSNRLLEEIDSNMTPLRDLLGKV